MRDRLPEFGDTNIAVITFAEADRLAAHRDHLDLPFPLLSDPTRKVYHQFELERGSVARVWGPKALWMYVELIGKGRRPRPPTEDTLQLGGDFVIDSDGRLRAGFWPPSPDTRPPVSAILDAINQAREPDD